MAISFSPFRNIRWAAAAAAVVAVLVYANSLKNDFAYDDLHIIQENAGIHRLADIPAAVAEPYWPGDYGSELGLWRPVTTAYLGVVYALSGGTPFLYHLANVVGHAAVTVLVVILLGEFLAVPAAFFAGLLFAVHPVHVEAVANVIGVAEILSAVFFLGACLLHVRGGDRLGWGRTLAMAALYALAFGTKESAVTLPGVLLLIDAVRRRLGFGELTDYLRRRGVEYAALALTAGLMLWARYHVLGSIANPFGPLGADLLQEIPRIWTLAEVWSHYVRLMVFPMDLSVDYSPLVIPISLGWHALNLTGLILALGILAGALLLCRGPYLGRGVDSVRIVPFGVLWFLITISPVSNVFFMSGVILAERTLYLPSVGFVALAGWLLSAFVRERPRVGYAVLAAAVLLMGARSYERNTTWRNNITVFGTLIEDYPQSGRSQWVLGDLFFQKGRMSQGLVSYRAAINILGPHYQLITEISKKLMAADYLDTAEHLLTYSWKEHPDFSVAPGLLAVIYSERGDPVETERFSRIVLAMRPDDVVRHHLLAWALTEQGRWAEAVEERKNAIRLGEGDYWQQWVSLAYLQAHAGDTVAAAAAMDSAQARVVTEDARRYVDSLYVEIVGVEPPNKS